MGEFLHARQSRVGIRNSGGGEIVEVQGGHIVRSISRKDRHSKVCTSKGPKDRRVRLSANTAIQFYDVQDRLGYDRPSKAVDWLIKKAKSAIDELDELPPWKPSIKPSMNSSSSLDFDKNPDQETSFQHNSDHHHQETANFVSSLNFDHNPDQLTRFEQHPDQNSNFLQSQSLDTIKSFFPMGASSTPVNGDSPAMQYHHHHHHQTTPFLQSLFSQTTEESHLFNSNSQRGPLQSSYTPSIRGWIDQPSFAGESVDHRTGFSSGGFSGFFVPARFQGEQEEHDGISDKPSSASSDSRH